MERRAQNRPGRRGFTLIEMLVVIAIMAAVLAMAAPRFLPIILYTTHEGAARRLANFGSAAIAESALRGETLYAQIDLERQEYWLERIPDPPEEAPLHAAMDEDDDLPEDDGELEQLAREELKRRAEEKGTEDGQQVLEEQSSRMAAQSNLRVRKALVAQAARIRHDENALPRSVREKMNPTLAERSKRDEMDPEAVTTAVLGRTRLPREIQFAWVEIGGARPKGKVATIEIGAAGLDVEAAFGLINESGDVFVVRWDPVSGTTGFREETEE